MVNCTATLTALAADYAALGHYVGLAVGNPGSTATPANEASGGSPAYARIAGTWSAGGTGVQNMTPVTVNAPAATYNYMLLASAVSGANMFDNGAITTVVMAIEGQIVLTLTYSQI